MPITPISHLSRAAKTFHKKIASSIPNATAVQEDLIIKLCECWDTYRTISDVLQKQLDEHGTFCITQGTGSLKLHPMVTMQKDTLAQYLSILRRIEKSSGEELPEADAIDEFFEG